MAPSAAASYGNVPRGWATADPYEQPAGMDATREKDDDVQSVASSEERPAETGIPEDDPARIPVPSTPGERVQVEVPPVGKGSDQEWRDFCS